MRSDSRPALARWIAAGLLGVLASSPAAAHQGQAGGQVGMPVTVVCQYGPSTCNCTSQTITASICHTKEFEIGLGDDIAHVSTGYSSSVCATVPIPPGTCAYWKYTFHCVHRCGLWGLWCTTSCSAGPATVYQEPVMCDAVLVPGLRRAGAGVERTP